MDALALWTVSAITLVAILAGIEGGYRLGRATRARSEDEKESPVSAIAGTILAMLAFIMAFTFGIVSDRYDARKALVLEEANAIRTAWLRSAFLPEPDRGEAAALLRQYVDDRLSSIQSGDFAAVQRAVVRSGDIQRRLWDTAVANARKDMNSDVAALYIDALNTVTNVHASRVSVGIHGRMPAGIWMALYALIMLEHGGRRLPYGDRGLQAHVDDADPGAVVLAGHHPHCSPRSPAGGICAGVPATARGAAIGDRRGRLGAEGHPLTWIDR